MIKDIKSKLALNLSNFKGQRSKKIVIIESDDWGSIRMVSKKMYNKLVEKGIRVDKSKYDTLDCLETNEDLLLLFDLLSKYKDIKGNHPKFTFNTVMANPDFNKIRDSKFTEFYNRSFMDSYKFYYNENNEDIWNYAINNNLMKPQFHAREHLNSELWLKDLGNNFKAVLDAFDCQFFGIKTQTSIPNQIHYLAAYNASTLDDFDKIKNITNNGLAMFESFFGFKSSSFIACNYTWPEELEFFLYNKGVTILQGQRGQITPILNENKNKIKFHYTGQKNILEQKYSVRNVFFEPYENSNVDWVDKAMHEIQNAFFWNTPAIISSHRINYVSHLNLKNRDISLMLLDKLIKKILNKWPDVEFRFSDETFKDIN